MRLAETQAALAALISGEVEASPEALGFIAESPVDSRRRVTVYAEAIRSKAAHAVGIPYRKLSALLGDEGFVDLVDGFKRGRPPERRTLRELVFDLPEFLDRERRWGRDDLGALAALELANHEVALDLGVEPVGSEALAGLEARRWPAATLRLVPALRLLSLPFDVSGLWKALDEGLPPPAPVARPTRFLAWRKGLDVYHCVLSASEATALDRAAAAAPLSEVLTAFDEADTAHSALHAWFTDGLVGAVNA
jgi:hypothetical protein